MLINPIMLNVNALEMERKKKQSQILTQLGEGWKDLLITQHKLTLF